MKNESSASLEDIRRFLESDTRIELTRVQGWLATEDEESLGAIYVALSEHSTRIRPEPDPMMAVDLLLRMIRTGEVRRGSREFGLSPYDAADSLLGHAREWDAVARDRPEMAERLSLLVQRLAAEYKGANEVHRRRIVDGFLEHAFETPSLRACFEGWRDVPVLSRAYAEAAHWAEHRNE